LGVMCVRKIKMDFNICPICKARLKMKLLGYKAICQRCNIQPEESGLTKGLQIVTLIIGFISMTLLQKQGTERILAENPADIFWALFPYYLSIVFYVGLAVGIANYVIRNYFAIYEPPRNT
jgi:hypothetical protein